MFDQGKKIYFVFFVGAFNNGGERRTLWPD